MAEKILQLKRSLPLIGILLFGIFLRFWGIRWGLPYEFQSEEYKVVKYALKMGSGDLNPHFFEYPSLYLYVMLIFYGVYFLIGRGLGWFHSVHDFALSFVKDPSPFYLIGRISEALCGLAIVFMVYKIGEKIFSKNTGLWAAMIVSGLPHFVYVSRIIKGYMGLILLLLLFFWMILKVLEHGNTKSYILSGMFMGLAISTRYHAAPFGILLPTAHILSRRRNHKLFLLSLFLIPVFFILTTPYSVLSPREFWADVGGNMDIYSSLTGKEKPFPLRLLTAAKSFLTLGDIPTKPGVGLICILGFFLALFHWERKHWLAVVPICTYLLIVGGYHNPAGGYLLPVFPLFILWAVAGLSFYPGKNAKNFLTVLLLGIVCINSWEGVKWAYSFQVEDTRSAAKDWIEKNIPYGSKILIGVKVQSPPLQMSYEQLEKFYQKAVKLNHPKKDYLKLQLEAVRDKNAGYRICMIKRSFRQIGSLQHQVEEVQQLQDLVEVDENIDRLKKNGIEYVIVEQDSEAGALKNNTPGLADFYRALPMHSHLIKGFSPKYEIAHSGAIRIYKL